MRDVGNGLVPGERERLARKGRLLYDRSCGPQGQGTCAERFAIHHLRQGKPEVARDLLAFLDSRVEALTDEDPGGQREVTRDLADRIRHHLEAEGDEPTGPPE